MLLSKKEIAELHKINQEHCVSIFISTHRGGKKILQEEDKLNLKLQLKNVKNKLAHRGLHKDTIDKITTPVQQLIDDSAFWREQSDGLAIYLADGFFRSYRLPIHFKEYNYVRNSFYLKPLLPMFVDNGNFYLMLLQLENVNLYECNKHTISEIIIHDLIPEKIEGRMGYGYKQKKLQFRTRQTDLGQIMYHRQKAAATGTKEEIKKYLRAVYEGILPVINEERIPLLIASQDYIFDIYKSVNNYKYLFGQNIKGNLDYVDIFEMHERAWEKIVPVFEQKRKDKIAAFKELHGTGKTTTGITNTLNAAFTGKIDTLFCQNNTDIYGNYRKQHNSIMVEESKENTSAISLLNLAAVKTFLKGGKVYSLEKEEMPDSNSSINALYRH